MTKLAGKKNKNKKNHSVQHTVLLWKVKKFCIKYGETSQQLFCMILLTYFGQMFKDPAWDESKLDNNLMFSLFSFFVTSTSTRAGNVTTSVNRGFITAWIYLFHGLMLNQFVYVFLHMLITLDNAYVSTVLFKNQWCALQSIKINA